MKFLLHKRSTPSPSFRVQPCGFAQMRADLAVVDSSGLVVDVFRSRSGAEYAVRLLEHGAMVNPHAPLGCRVTL